MLLSTFTLGDTLLALLELAFLFLWIWIAVGVVFDIFRSHDLSNWGKALWMLSIVIVPFLGVLGYLIVRGHTMHEHHERDLQARHAAFGQLARSAVPAGPADDIARLADLRDRGVLTDEEFERAKAKVLA